MERNKNYKDILLASSSTGLPVKKIVDTLYYLRDGGLKNNTLLQMVGVSRNVLNQTKAYLNNILNHPTESTELSAEGLQLTEELNLQDYIPEEKLLSAIETNSFATIGNGMEIIASSRLTSIRALDQFQATLETVGKRASLMDFFADIKGKRILFLGDDDFTSIVVASYRKAETIAVLDIDGRIIQNISRLSNENKYEISVENYDAKEKLPPHYRGKFDVVFTDPPYTPIGISLFLSRAIQALDPQNESARIYFCYGNSDRARERFLPIYEILVKSGLMMRWVFDKFNRYEGAESIGSASSLFVCDVTPKTKPIAANESVSQLYTI